jgi:hypothetical protein
VTPLIDHIIMSYVNQATNFTTEFMFDGHRCTTAIAELRHGKQEKIISQLEVVTELLR